MPPMQRISRAVILLLLFFLSMKVVSAQSSDKPIEPKLEEEYAAGINAFETRNWPRAIIAFENVVKIKRNHRDARVKLERAKRQLELESLNAVLADSYAEGETASSQGDFQAALAAFKKVYQSAPDYRDVAERIASLEQARREENAVVSIARLDSLYLAAVILVAEKKWLEAAVQLERVQLLKPGHRETSGLLRTAKANLQASGMKAAPKEAPHTKTFLGMGPVLAFAILAPVIGFVAFSPSVRARYHFWRSNYGAAAGIYEKQLARHPSRVKHYPALADIYLLQDRRDEPALRVYKTILQLNLPFRHREEINNIIAQKFLVEGRTDLDAIEVLENALKTEQRKYSQSR